MDAAESAAEMRGTMTGAQRSPAIFAAVVATSAAVLPRRCLPPHFAKCGGDSAADCAAVCAAVKQVERLKGWAEPVEKLKC